MSRLFQRNAPNAMVTMTTAAATATRSLDSAGLAGRACQSVTAVPVGANGPEDSGVSASSAVASSPVDAKRCSGDFSRHRLITR